MWVHGKHEGFGWEAKIYQTGSKFGIDGGRISKMELKDSEGTSVGCYDRGDGYLPVRQDAQEAWGFIVNWFG